jgi:rod shape-determining protein MreC
MSWFQRNRVRIFFAALLLFLFLIFIARMKDPRNLNWMDRALIWITSPFQHAVVWVFDGVAGIFGDYVYLVGVHEENQKLKEQVEQLQRELSALEETRVENLRLRKLVNMSESLGDIRMVAARVVGVGTSPFTRIIRIDVGSNDGVKEGDAVIAGAGLAGRVMGTTGGYSRVRLLVDSQSAVAVVDQRSRAQAMVRCKGEDDLCSLSHLVRTADVEVGDLVVTSGAGGAYPRGLLVGRISRVTSPSVGVFRQAELVPAVEFQSLEEVLVVTSLPSKDQPPEPEEGDVQ